MTDSNLAERAAHVELHDRLFDKGSIVGATAVLVVLSFFGFGLQLIDDQVRAADGFAVGEPFVVSLDVAFTPVAGWINDADQGVPGSSVIAHKNGWDFRLATGLELSPDETLTDYADAIRETDPGSDVTVDDPTTFVTNSGLHGLTWKSHQTSTASITWLIELDNSFVQILSGGPATSLDLVDPELDSMVESLTGPGSAAS